MSEIRVSDGSPVAQATADTAKRQPGFPSDPAEKRVLTCRQQARVKEYIQRFLSQPEHSTCFDPDLDLVMESLLDPNRLSIALMPVDKHIGACEDDRAVGAWYYKYVKGYARSHRDFLNNLSRNLKAKLFTAKLLRHLRERNVRDFLRELARSGELPAAARRFFRGLDLHRNLLRQGVRIWECQDFSSGRGYDEGAIVNRIVLSRKGGRVSFFLKGLGATRKRKCEAHGLAHFENFEVTALQAARMVGLNSIACKRYLDETDPLMVGYTLLQEIDGQNTNHLFLRLPNGRFVIQPDLKRHRDRLIGEFARIAAFSDLLRKGDRKIVQPIHPEYDANCLVSVQLLQGRSRCLATWTIDFNHLFQEDNRGVLHDIKHGQCTEIGILAAFPEFYLGVSSRAKLLGRYRRAYFSQWARIQRKWRMLEQLIAEQHGRDSNEYNVFRESLATDPRSHFEPQKNALLRAFDEVPHPAKCNPTQRANGSSVPTGKPKPAGLMGDNPLRFFTHDRLDLVVKYRLFENLLRGEMAREVEEAYLRHILARTGGIEPGNSSKTSIELHLPAARVLFQRMSAIGFDRSAPVPVDQWGRLRDGAHRVACAAVLGLQVELFYVKAQHPIRQWGIDWFIRNGFSKRYVNGLLDHLNVITGYSNRSGEPADQKFGK